MEGAFSRQREKSLWLSGIKYCLVFTLSLIPLLSLLKVVPFEGHLYANFPLWNESSDFFAWYKSKALIFVLFTLLFFMGLGWKKIRSTFQERMTLVYLSVYVVAVILSCLFSQYQTLVYWGFPNRYEGLWVLLCYPALFYATTLYLRNQGSMQHLIYGIALTSSVCGLIGIFQYFGFHPFEWSGVKELIWQGDPRLHTLKLAGVEGGTITSTLYNSNFVGSYFSIIFPLSIFLFLGGTGKSRLAYGLWSILAFSALLGSHSRSSWLGVMVALVIFSILFRGELKRNIKPLAGLLVVFIGVSAAMISYPNNLILHRLEKSVKEMQTTAAQRAYLQNRVVIIAGSTDTESIHLVPQAQGFDIRGGEGRSIPYQINQGEITFSDMRFAHIKIRLASNGKERVVLISGENFLRKFVLADQAFYDYPREKSVHLFPERLFSKRGYIWNRTIPLLADATLLGKGADTFAVEFPNKDMGHGDIVDKPHSLYLGIWHSTGAIALVVFIMLSWGNVIPLLKSIRQKKSPIQNWIPAGITCGTIAHLICSATTDSHVGVTPTLWICLAVVHSTYRNY